MKPLPLLRSPITTVRLLIATLMPCLPLAAATTNVVFGGATTALYTFRPPDVVINVGDSVVWTNAGGLHTVTGGGSDAICGSGNVTTTCPHTFNEAGTYPYLCIYHAGAPFNMTGVVHVVGVTLPSPPVLTNALMQANNHFQFTVLTTANHTNTVQATTNLGVPSNWVPVTTVVPASNSFIFTDTNASQFGIRIYRVVEQ